MAAASLVCAVLLALLACGALGAPVLQFASYYGSHMVLQRAPQWSNVWGFGVPGTEMQLMLMNSTWKWLGNSAVSDVAPYTWKVQLPPATGGPYTITIFDGITSVTIIDILFGDVWLCSGQSNMEFTVPQAWNATEEIAAAANYPQIRFFTVSLLEDDNGTVPDLLSINQYWSVASPSSINSSTAWDYFSATCWFFGRNLADSLGSSVPLGLLVSCYGGTVVEAWSSPQSLEKCGWINPPLYERAPPRVPGELFNPNANPSSLYNSMIYPLLNMTIKGAIWYQGESNVFNPSNYSCTFPAMIADWRAKWAASSNTSPSFPFGFVQLAGYCTCAEPPNECNNTIANISIVAPVRMAQTANYGVAPNQAMPNTFMASAVDLADPDSPECDIHPRFKQEVGRRLSLGALNTVYGQSSLPFQGPYPTNLQLSSTVLSKQLTQWQVGLTFSNPGSGLMIENANVNTVVAFELYWNANVTIIAPILGTSQISIVVAAPALTSLGKPVAIRHLWRDRPCENYNPTGGNCLVYNSYGLPATPFFINFS